MKQQIKIINAWNLSELEEKVNDFLDEWEIRGIQVLTNKNTENPVERYIAVIKYQATEPDWK